MTEKQAAATFDTTQEGVGVIRLNQPDIHNAFTQDLEEALVQIVENLKGADGVRCVFVEGAGKSFSAGADLNAMKRAARWSHSDNVDAAKSFSNLLHHIRTLPMPTIALVNGAAMGGGVGLVAACDIAIATKKAFFSLSEVRLGLIPSMISPYVIEAIGSRQARRYFTTGERFDAEEAERIGLVHIVVEDLNELAKEGERIADSIIQNGPQAVHAAKELIDAVMWREIDHHMINETAKRIADRRATDEAMEGMTAFLEKRKPSWAK